MTLAEQIAQADRDNEARRVLAVELRRAWPAGTVIVDTSRRRWRIEAWADDGLAVLGGGCLLRCLDVDITRGCTAWELEAERRDGMWTVARQLTLVDV